MVKPLSTIDPMPQAAESRLSELRGQAERRAGWALRAIRSDLYMSQEREDLATLVEATRPVVAACRGLELLRNGADDPVDLAELRQAVGDFLAGHQLPIASRRCLGYLFCDLVELEVVCEAIILRGGR